jgi:hypothetical protein
VARELRKIRSEGSNESCKVRVARLANRQAGRVATYQFGRLGVGRSSIHDWVAAGYLHEVMPRVYGVGHVASSREADLWAAVLYAGPGAALSHLTAAWWRGLVAFPGSAIHVSTARSCISAPGVIVHGRWTDHERVIVRGLPTATVADSLLGLAACTPDLVLVRKALARIEYAHGTLDVASVRAACGRGRAGSARLNRALADYDAGLGDANGPLEDGFFVFCKQRVRKGIPIPQLNATIGDVIVDAYFPTMASWLSSTATPTTARRFSAGETVAARPSSARMGSRCCATTGCCSSASPNWLRPICCGRWPAAGCARARDAAGASGSC